MERRILFTGLAAIFLVGLALWVFRGGEESPESGSAGIEPGNSGPVSPVASHSPQFTAPEAADEPALEEGPADAALRADLETLRRRLATRPDRETVIRLLREFTQKALSAQPDGAAAALLEFLRSGEDLSTGLDFVVGEGGLDEWPSLRAYLLDLLGKIDLERASRYALANVIPAETSTVEYAVALRIFWLDERAEGSPPDLTRSWLRLFRKPEWANQPDAAWMECLDFAGCLPGVFPEFAATATGWLANPSDAAAQAEGAQMAMERAMRNHPVETLSGLLGNRSLLAKGDGPIIRATLFARADPGDPAQAAFLRQYLSILDPGSPETTAFFQAFPFRKSSVSPGLSGLPILQTREEILASNLAAAAFFKELQEEGSLPQLRDKILKTQGKLEMLSNKNR